MLAWWPAWPYGNEQATDRLMHVPLLQGLLAKFALPFVQGLLAILPYLTRLTRHLGESVADPGTV